MNIEEYFWKEIHIAAIGDINNPDSIHLSIAKRAELLEGYLDNQKFYINLADNPILDKGWAIYIIGKEEDLTDPLRLDLCYFSRNERLAQIEFCKMKAAIESENPIETETAGGGVSGSWLSWPTSCYIKEIKLPKATELKNKVLF